MILIELTAVSFELEDQSSVESLRLNAELLDVIIDLFGEDNLTEVETNLNFIQRIKSFCENFYTKVRTSFYMFMLEVFIDTICMYRYIDQNLNKNIEISAYNIAIYRCVASDIDKSHASHASHSRVAVT